MMLFMIIFYWIFCVANAGIFTRGYPFTLLGQGYGKKLYPQKGMGTGDGKNWDGRVRVWGSSALTHTLRVPSLLEIAPIKLVHWQGRTQVGPSGGLGSHSNFRILFVLFTSVILKIQNCLHVEYSKFRPSSKRRSHSAMRNNEPLKSREARWKIDGRPATGGWRPPWPKWPPGHD